MKNTPEHIRLLEECVAELLKWEAVKVWAKDYTDETRKAHAYVAALVDRCSTFLAQYRAAEEDNQLGHS